MNALTIAVGLLALTGLVLAGVILGRREIRRGRQRDQAGQRQARIESAEQDAVKAERWPTGWNAIPADVE